MKKLYCFDFDGTLTTRDTMFLFLKFYNTRKFAVQFLKYSPLFVLVKVKLMKAENVKKSFIAAVLKGQSRTDIERASQQFFDKYYPKIIRKNALEFIAAIDRSHTDGVIVSASLDLWVRPFATQFNMRLLATQAEFRDDKFTGLFVGVNCNGTEKVCRLEKEISRKSYDKIIAFGDTSGDLPMLNWADEGHLKFFH